MNSTIQVTGDHVDGSVQDCSNSTANVKVLLQFCSFALSHRYDSNETEQNVGTFFVGNVVLT